MRLRKGQIVEVEFLDHVEGGSVPLAFVLYGRVAAITREAVVIDSWCYASSTERYDPNVNRHTIVRSAIKRVSQLERRA